MIDGALPLNPRPTIFQDLQKFICALFLGAGLLSACSIPGARSVTQTAQSIDLVAAQTLTALQAGTEFAQTATMPSRPTSSPLAATATPLPSATAWIGPIFIQVSIATNCRTGPGPEFPMIGALMVGETTVIRARTNNPNYWLVDNPDNPGRECWLWGRHATIDGDTDHLPLADAVDTPTPEPATIAGWAYFDGDNNGARGDPGDSALSGISLTLRLGACPGGLTISSALTDSKGRYHISNLIPAHYCLSHEETQPLMPRTWSIVLTPGQARDELNFRRIP